MKTTARKLQHTFSTAGLAKTALAREVGLSLALLAAAGASIGGLLGMAAMAARALGR